MARNVENNAASEKENAVGKKKKREGGREKGKNRATPKQLE